MEYIIVFDFGTGSGKCVLFDISGNELGKKTVKWDYSACPYGTPNDKTFPANIFCEKLFQLVNPTLKENNIQKTDIIAVAAVSQREGMVFLDTNENVIYSGPNIDLRGSLVTHLLKESSDEVKNITGLSIHGMYGLARLLWFKEYKPDIFHNIHKILMINDWLTYCLCGVFVSERSIASSSQLFDIKTGKWAYSLLDRFDISNESLPKIIPARSVAGYLNKQIAQLTGLQEGIPVFSAGGDTQSALIGMGAIETNKLCIIAGSTAPVILTVDSPKLFPYLTTSTHIIDNIWCLEANAGQTGTSLRWVIKNFDNSDIFTYDFLQEKAAASPIGSNGICSYLGTMIPGEKLNENLGGFIFPIPWDINDLSIKDICRSSIESAIFSVCACTEYLLSQNKSSVQSVYLCGGQKKGKVFVQGLSDVMNIPIITTQGEETTALGAAIIAAVGLGIYPDYSAAIKNMVGFKEDVFPGSKGAKEYATVYKRWRELREKMIHLNSNNQDGINIKKGELI